MPWNYRILHTSYAPPEGMGLEYYSVRDVYYTAEGAVQAMGMRGARPGGETLAELQADLARMQEAFARPVLTPNDIPGYTYDRWEISPVSGATP